MNLMSDTYNYVREEKFLGTPKVWRNSIHFSYIYGKPHHKFNE